MPFAARPQNFNLFDFAFGAESEVEAQVAAAQAAVTDAAGRINSAKAAIDNANVFEKLMDAVRVCSLGQITTALFEVGGQYRRNM